jgi:hypothetical protein
MSPACCELCCVSNLYKAKSDVGLTGWVSLN